MLLATQLASIFKAANPQAPFTFLVTDWLYHPKAEIRKIVAFIF